MRQTVWISTAGVAGVLARYYLSLGVTRLLGSGFPYATVLINVSGSFLIGLIYVLGIEQPVIKEPLRVALMVGALGGFTTFSSFSLETVRMAMGGQAVLAALNVLGSLAFGLGATVAGIALGRAMGN